MLHSHRALRGLLGARLPTTLSSHPLFHPPNSFNSFMRDVPRFRPVATAARVSVEEDMDIDETKAKCDPYEQGGKPLPRDEAEQYVERLDAWKILEFPASASPPTIVPNYASTAPSSTSASASCGKAECACAAKAGSVTVSSCSSSSTLSASPSSSSDPTLSNVQVGGAGANARRFKGGLLLRREWRFRTVQAGIDFIEQIKIISTNMGHPPYRVVLDASRSYGHVVVELYTTRLGGLSYNDFSLAQMIDSALNTYRKKAAATSATQTSSA